MPLRIITAGFLSSLLFINSIGLASQYQGNDNNAGPAPAKVNAFTWDSVDKATTERIFNEQSPSADDLENLFCAVHVKMIWAVILSRAQRSCVEGVESST